MSCKGQFGSFCRINFNFKFECSFKVPTTKQLLRLKAISTDYVHHLRNKMF